MYSDEHQALLTTLAEAIQRRGLTTPVGLLLDLIAPLDILASQTAVFVQPFTPEGRWRQYARLFEDSASWRALRLLLAQG